MPGRVSPRTRSKTKWTPTTRPDRLGPAAIFANGLGPANFGPHDLTTDYGDAVHGSSLEWLVPDGYNSIHR